MSTDDLQARADARFEAALAERGARDPREFYRERLRELKRDRPEAYARALDHYRQEVLPQTAREDRDPLQVWLEYGRTLAELTAEGRTIMVDETGRSQPYRVETGVDHLVLHLPDDGRLRAILVGLPPQLSPAQRATYDLLVRGKNKMAE